MITYDEILALVHAFLAVVTTALAVATYVNHKAIKKIEFTINGRMEQLLKMAKETGFQEGLNAKKIIS